MDLTMPSTGLIFWQILGLLSIVVWVYTIFDCLKSEFRGPNQKLIWVMIILLMPIVVGPVLYLGMSRRTKEKRSFQPNFTNSRAR